MIPFASPAAFDGCPPRQTLDDFNCGRLTELALETIANHLARCESCLGTLSEIQRRAAVDGIDAQLRGLLEPNDQQRPPSRDPARIPSPTPKAVETAGDNLIGTTIGRYTLLAMLGAGGMGVVYRAKQTPLGQVVALKTIRDIIGSGPGHLTRFRTEGATLARLQHPNVVRLYHFDHYEGYPYFTMELMEGGSLASRLEEAPLTCEEAAQLLRTLARAVAYFHNQGVIHRDLKPQNVLLTADGTAKVSDFGLAKLLDDESKLTVSGYLMGTPSYMAPEQTKGSTHLIGKLTDVYALGAILYECLTGRPPFDGANRTEITGKVQTEEPAPPSVWRSGIPTDLEAVCLKCLEKDAHWRYESAAALAADLDRYLQGLPTQARPLTCLRRMWRRARRASRRDVLVLSLGFTGIVGGVASYSHASREEATDAPESLEELNAVLAQAKPGQPVTLIDETGKPKWFRWVMGKVTGKIFAADDGTFTLNSPVRGLVELLPNPQVDRYCFRAQVRHSRSEYDGEVGLYVGREAHPGGPVDIHVFSRLTFNDVRRPVEAPIDFRVGRDGKAVMERRNPVDPTPKLVLHFASEEGRPPDICSQANLQVGLPSSPLGEDSGHWRNLELIVTPKSITARWDTQPPLVASVQEISQKRDLTLDFFRRSPIHKANPFLQALQPRHNPRGGLGIYLSKGWASFRGVSITPRSGNE